MDLELQRMGFQSFSTWKEMVHDSYPTMFYQTFFLCLGIKCYHVKELKALAVLIGYRLAEPIGYNILYSLLKCSLQGLTYLYNLRENEL